MHIHVLSTDCKGPNRACRTAHREGRPVHVMPTHNVRKEAALVMPTYHYATADEGRAAIREAVRTAPTVYGDADLYLYREQGIPHFLPVGWVDPTMRGTDCTGDPPLVNDKGYPMCPGSDMAHPHYLCFMERRDWDECPECGHPIPDGLKLNDDMTGPRS